MADDGRKLTGISVPAGRREEFDAALLKLKQRRPFDSSSKLVVDAVIAAAAALDESTTERAEEPAHAA